ncbi:MAG: penicillin-binding protein 2 [Candidatus Krumholzibacteriota bacterium]
MAEREHLIRRGIFRTVVIILFLILVGNIFVMMVPQHAYYKDQALKNRQVRFRVRAPRGLIKDRNGIILADNTYIADITVPGSSLGSAGPDTTLSRLINWFDLPREDTLQRLREQKEAGGRGGLVLVSNATMPQIAAVEERGRQLPGVRVEARPRRRYLFGELFAHVIGYVGEVVTADLDTTGESTGYKIGDMIGKQGAETALEDRLRGGSGTKLEEVNASGRVVGRRPVWLQEVTPGLDVTLSISLEYQHRMAEAIGERTACGVALDTRTGEVLAAFSHPAFDPNLMTVPITADQWNDLSGNPDKPFFNRIVQATYPPASLYKPVTSLAGLANGVIGTSSVLEPCLGGWSFGNRYFRCWKRAGHGLVDHTEAIVQSCDTFYYQLGLRLEIDQLAAAARSLGLGRVCTNIFADEAAGNIPDTAWYDKRFGKGKWTRGVLLNNSIGQGEILVTPIQMALLTARLATSGKTPDPVFVVNPRSPAKMPEALPYRERDLAWVRRSMELTVSEGTGKAAALDSIAVAGKTGTAQNPHGDDHAWFMCFAPVGDPQVAMVVIVENAGHGSSEAAPVAGQWLRTFFAEGDSLSPPPSPVTTNGRGH